MSTDQQRSYTAPCPGCGAPVEFASAQSAYAVCPYCQSSIVRSGDVLKRIGKMAEIFNDYSPLKLGQTGELPRNQQDKKGPPEGFRLVGRLQYQGEAGSWNEWQALTDAGEIAVISEDNGQFVLSRESQAPASTPQGFHCAKTTMASAIQPAPAVIPSVHCRTVAMEI